MRGPYINARATHTFHHQQTPTMTFTISIPVKKRGQRTLRIVGGGLKALLTTRVSGKLVIRTRTPADTGRPPPQTIPWQNTPQLPDPNVPTEEEPEEGVQLPATATDWGEDAHKNAVSHGVKVRDFAYPATCVGHTNPFHRRPWTLSVEEIKKIGKEKAKEIGYTPLTAPMPSVPRSWEVPHPSLRPVAEPPVDRNPKPPTPEKPFSPLYDTHRIPTPFNQPFAVAVVIYRLAENPRTVPIHGSITRRLLTLSPDMIDLSQYAEMDLEELRRYDRSIVWQLQHGIEPYPWYTETDSTWVPSADNAHERQFFAEQGRIVAKRDLGDQNMSFSHAYTMLCKDEQWEAERVNELRREHELAAGVVFRDEEEDPLLTADEWARVWMRRWESDQGSERFPGLKSNIPLLLKRDWDANVSEGDNELDEPEMLRRVFDPYAGVKPPWPLGFPPVQETLMGPVGPYWGPNNVWDRYRLYGGVPTGKTLGEYLAVMSSRVDDGSPWPLPRSLKRKSEDLESDGESEDGDEVFFPPTCKRARTA
ncbi:hypothetical protein C8R46DRAFT_1075996 [Mycena filopes]|nr:hypothetical protein C8R46DRAFT_1075996 [Mycena filopes]